MSTSDLGIGPGAIIQDTYKLTRLLGEGGMGATFEGVNLVTQHEVAVKVITPQFARNKQAADLFKREANLLRTVQSPAIVRYETTIMDKQGRLYLVMEFIRGKPLAYFLGRGAKLAARDVLKLALRLLEGLHAIHRLDIVHRDISPDNIMIPDEDILGAKLIDFGVASDTIGMDKSIIGDSFVGKISYAAPEQLGLGGNIVSKATDIYALGLVLMKTAGLAVPGAGGNLAQAIDARRADIRITDPKVNPILAKVLEALLRADPKDRPRDPVGLVTQALAQFETPKTTAAPASAFDDEPLPATQEKKKSSFNVQVAVAILVMAAIGGIGWLLKSSGDQASGVAVEQAQVARTATQAVDPLSEITGLIDSGTSDNLNAAFGALVAIARDEARPQTLRARAAMMVAQMYDPQTYNAKRSPFPAPNANAAKRFYTQARDLGAAEAQAALDRL